MNFREDDQRWLADFLRERTGIALAEGSAYLLETRLSPLMERMGISGPPALVARLQDSREEPLRTQVVERMTTHETRFFRDDGLFRALRTHLFAEAAEAHPGEPVRVWCAAASTGQEPWSIAMVAKECADVSFDPPVEILATDLSAEAVSRGREALYSQLEVTQGLTNERLERHFLREGRHWRVRPELRGQVRWERRNLIDPARTGELFDFILCRNVLIYFEGATRAAVLRRLSESLRPSGALLLGSGETADLSSTDLVRLADGEAGSLYRLSGPDFFDRAA